MNKRKKVQIMLLGSTHFSQESGFDLCSEKVQAEIRDLVNKLSKFNPDKIMVEAPIESQHQLTAGYQALPADYFSDYEKMKTTDLGNIEIAGNEYPIPYISEAVQIGFRMAKKLQKDNVYGIDYIEMVDESPIYERASKEITGWNEQSSQFWTKFDEDVRRVNQKGTITDLFKYYNGEWSLRQHSLFYLSLNQIGAGTDYSGSQFLTRWYERNIKIFSNLQKVSMGCERVFIIYGAGHLATLENFISQYEDMQLVNVYEYL